MLAMREFKSWMDYRQFASSIMRKSRYVFEPDVEDFLQTVVETGQHRKRRLDFGQILWRAQLGHTRVCLGRLIRTQISN